MRKSAFTEFQIWRIRQLKTEKHVTDRLTEWPILVSKKNGDSRLFVRDLPHSVNNVVERISIFKIRFGTSTLYFDDHWSQNVIALRISLHSADHSILYSLVPRFRYESGSRLMRHISLGKHKKRNTRRFLLSRFWIFYYLIPHWRRGGQRRLRGTSLLNDRVGMSLDGWCF